MGQDRPGRYPNREIDFARAGVGPPSSLYVTREELLLVRYKALAAKGISFRARVLTPDGVVVPIDQQFTTSTTGTIVTQGYQLPEGFLLSAAIIPVGSSIDRGQIYVQLGLAVGNPTTFTQVMVLSQGYLTDSATVSWPGGLEDVTPSGYGFLRSVTGTDPAAGVEISETIGTGRQTVLYAFRATLVTDATVPARTAQLVIDDGATPLIVIQPSATQAASLTRAYGGVQSGAVVAGLATEITWLIPSPVRLRNTWRIRTLTDQLAVGDNWGAPQYFIEELLAP